MRIFQLTIFILVLLIAAPAYAQTVRKGIIAYESGDFAAALREWRPLADKGNGIAQAGLGLLYARGQGVPQDHIEAVKWFRLSAEQGNVFGQNNLADMYRNGHGVLQNYPEAVLFYRLSAAQGYALAQSSLGFMYENGNGIRQDYKKAYMWYTLAAEQGHEGANQSRLSLGRLMSIEDRWEALGRAQERQKRKEVARVRKQFNPADASAPQKVTAGAAPANTSPTHSATLKSPTEIGAKPSSLPQVPISAGEPPAMAANGAWRIQLISLKRQTDAEKVWNRLVQVNTDLLNILTLHVQTVELSEGIFFRLQAGPFADKAAAASLCDALRSRNQDCLVVAP